MYADNSKNYGVWWELIGTNKSEQTHYLENYSFKHNAGGDTYYADITYSNGTANFYIYNSTTKAVTSFKETGITFIGTLNRAAWIVEKTSVNNELPLNLANFGYVHFAQAQYGTSNGLFYLSGNSSASDTNKINMRSTVSTALIAQPGAIDSTGGFDVVWYNYN